MFPFRLNGETLVRRPASSEADRAMFSLLHSNRNKQFAIGIDLVRTFKSHRCEQTRPQ